MVNNTLKRMNEPRTFPLLYDLVTEDYTWRIKELSNFKVSVLTAKGESQKGMIRAGVAILYAHWEGYIKKCADLYYDFVCYQNCSLNELNNSFVSIALKSEMEKLQGTKKLIIQNEVIKVFFEKQNQKAYLSSTSPIKTFNLKYNIFEDVCMLLGIDIMELHERYKKKYDRNIQKTIDDELVGNRNNIAHGNYLPLDQKQYTELYNVIVNGLLYYFKEIVMDAAQNKKYLK